MKCLYCTGEMEKTKSTYTVNRNEYHLFIDKIPVYVCTHCGQRYFEEEEISAIQNMIGHLEADLHKVQCLV